MQLGQLIVMVDTSKPNHYDKDIKTQWINEIEFKVIDQILNKAIGNNIEYKPYKYDEDSEKELLIPEQFIDVYVNYLSAKIDFLNAEFERYNSNAALFQASFDDFAAWYRRKNLPKPASTISPL